MCFWKLLSIFSFVAATNSAMAESAADAMRAFGIAGTWSSDCSKQMQHPCTATSCPRRSTYSIPLFGDPTLTAELKLPNSRKITSVARIQSAARVTDEKLQLDWVLEEDALDRPIAWVIVKGERGKTVIVKNGNKIRQLSVESLDGKKFPIRNGMTYVPPSGTKDDEIPSPETWVPLKVETQWLEKCLN
jgi:hypothetical protein